MLCKICPRRYTAPRNLRVLPLASSIQTPSKNSPSSCGFSYLMLRVFSASEFIQETQLFGTVFENPNSGQGFRSKYLFVL